MATTSQEYTLERKTGENTSEEVQIPASSVSGLAKVATSGSYNDLSYKPTIPDVSGKANLDGGNTFSGQQDINGVVNITNKYTSGGFTFNGKDVVTSDKLPSFSLVDNTLYIIV